jgi:hypothetical protein
MLNPAIGDLQDSAQDPDRCLEQIEVFVDYLLCEPLAVGRVFGSRMLDDLCQRIGRHNLAALGLAKPPLVTSGVAVYIASKLQSSGGHTAALLDVIRLSPKRRSIILVTGVCGSTDYKAIHRRLSEAPNVELVRVPPGGHLQKLSWIQKYLNEQIPSIVWLFNHHQDSVAIAAVQPDRGYSLNFYHHGDDRLCLGVCLSYSTHFDITPILFHRCRDEVGVKKNRYLPLTAIDLFGSSLKNKHESPNLVTCTAAGYNKVEAGYFFQYVDVIPHLLRVTGGRHIHIGHLSLFARWRVRRLMKNLGVPLKSFVYIPHVHSVWRALHEYQVDLYIASFPYGGGKTMVEVMGASVPIIIHRNIADRMIGGLDMVYDGACSWREPEELYQLLKSCTRDFLREQGALARVWYEKCHSSSAINEILTNPNSPINVPQLKPNYEADSLLHAWQIAREVTCLGVIKRRIWRLYRRSKSVLGRHPLIDFLKSISEVQPK